MKLSKWVIIYPICTYPYLLMQALKITPCLQIVSSRVRTNNSNHNVGKCHLIYPRGYLPAGFRPLGYCWIEYDAPRISSVSCFVDNNILSDVVIFSRKVYMSF